MQDLLSPSLPILDTNLFRALALVHVWMKVLVVGGGDGTPASPGVEVQIRYTGKTLSVEFRSDFMHAISHPLLHRLLGVLSLN